MGENQTALVNLVAALRAITDECADDTKRDGLTDSYYAAKLKTFIDALAAAQAQVNG